MSPPESEIESVRPLAASPERVAAGVAARPLESCRRPARSLAAVQAAGPHKGAIGRRPGVVVAKGSPGRPSRTCIRVYCRPVGPRQARGASAARFVGWLGLQ